MRTIEETVAEAVVLSKDLENVTSVLNRYDRNMTLGSLFDTLVTRRRNIINELKNK